MSGYRAAWVPFSERLKDKRIKADARIAAKNHQLARSRAGSAISLMVHGEETLAGQMAHRQAQCDSDASVCVLEHVTSGLVARIANFEVVEPAAHHRVVHSQVRGNRVQPTGASVVETNFPSNVYRSWQLEDRFFEFQRI